MGWLATAASRSLDVGGCFFLLGAQQLALPAPEGSEFWNVYSHASSNRAVAEFSLDVIETAECALLRKPRALNHRHDTIGKELGSVADRDVLTRLRQALSAWGRRDDWHSISHGLY